MADNGNNDKSNTPVNPSQEPPAQATPPSGQKRGALPWMGLGLALVLAGIIVWSLSPLSPFIGGNVSPTPKPATPGPATPGPTEVISQETPTPWAGAATFTPVAGVSGPRVLGITAGVGMRSGEIAGVAPMAVTFSEAMDQASAQSSFRVVPEAAGDFRWQENTLFFTPNTPLAPSTQYTVTVDNAAMTSDGKPLVVPISASFQTAPPPAILRTLPSAGASEVPTDTIVTVSFNRPMIPLTSLDNQPDAAPWVTISPQVAGRWVWLGTGAVGFRAETGFLPSTEYRVDVKAGWPDSAGVALAQGAAFSFVTIRPAILSVSPSNGSTQVPIDAPVRVLFNQPMDKVSVQGALGMLEGSTSTPLQGSYVWSPDSRALTFTAASLLKFDQSYRLVVNGKVKPAAGDAAELVGGASVNSWTFTTTESTYVSGHYPDSDSAEGQAQPTNNFGFSFNNPLLTGQDVARYLTVSPQPEGYRNLLEIGSDGTSVFTEEVRLLPNTTYRFALGAGLKDKWGLAVEPSTWEVKIGPLPPSLQLKGGNFQPIFAGGPSRVRVEAANLDKFTMHLHQLSEADIRKAWQSPPSYNPTPTYPGQLKRTWEVTVQKDSEGKAVVYPALGLDAASDRLPAGYYLLRATAPSPYSSEPLQGMAILIVGRAGVVIKSEGRDILVWAADLGSGKPVADYPLRVEQIRSNGAVVSQLGRTGQDGVMRLTLDPATDVNVTAVWSAQSGDAMFATTGWNNNVDWYNFGLGGSYGNEGARSALYTDRPIYRPAQVVYYRGVYRLDDDARYTIPPAGRMVELRAVANTSRGHIDVYTGTATLSGAGTFSGQFTLPANASTGTYYLSMSLPDPAAKRGPDQSYYPGATSAYFQVEEYRKPDFQVGVTTREEGVQGDPVTATIQTSYYFGGPLPNVTATINLQTSPHYFYWSDPVTEESYVFGEHEYRIYDYRSGPYPRETPEPVQSFQERTDKDGSLTVDVSRYVTTTSGSKSVLIEGQVQDLSNQAVANSANTVVHQGQYYVGVRVGEYIATAKQPLTVTVRTVNADGKRTEASKTVNLSFVRREWTAPRYGSGEEWKLVETPAGTATVSTNGSGRADYLFTPPSAGDYELVAESSDSRGNKIRTRSQFWVASNDPGYVPWRFQNEQQVELVADKEEYKLGDTARILVTSPFTQATGLLTIERGHLKRYRVVDIRGGAPTIEVKLEEGDLPNVYVSLTLLGPERPQAGAPADWANRVTMRQGYVNLALDTLGKELKVTIEPEGNGPFLPGSTANVKVSTFDSNGKPVQGELSLAVVDEAIYALAGENGPDLFGTFWGQRSSSVRTSTSFSSGNHGGRYGDGRWARGSMASSVPRSADTMPSTTAIDAGYAQEAANGAPAAPKKIRADFRDTAFWQASVTTGANGTANVPVPLPDNLTTWRLTTHAITNDTRAGEASQPMTVTQPLLLRPVQPRFLTTGDNPRPQAIIHNNTAASMQVDVTLEVSGALTLQAQPAGTQQVTVAPGEQKVVEWSVQVGKGDLANLRYWARTAGKTGPDYLEDAVAMSLPVKAFAAPEAVATSGEVGGTRAGETVFIPYSVNSLLGELVVQVSPSLAAATTDSLQYLKEYPYESTDSTVSRFLPLVVLEQVYNEQGFKTPYAQDIPPIMERAFKRLGELQQSDGGWSWWERGPSNWWETAYVVQGLTAARDAGYAVPGDMLQRGIDRLQGFMSENSAGSGIDETYHLNMRAYTLYVLTLGVGADDEMKREGQELAKQAPRISNHARAWLAMALHEAGLSAESKSVLDSLAAAARQSSTTAHWEESAPDYWSMGTDNRATALAIDALVTIAPSDPLVPKAVRWLMSAEKEGHWLSSQETSISLISLAHYIRQSKELGADYTWQVDAFGTMLGQGVANSGTLTQTTTLRLPVDKMPINTLGDLSLARSAANGKMYYSISLKYYVPGEGIQSRSEGLAVSRTYHRVSGGADSDPLTEVAAGDLVKVRLHVVVPETSHYVLVTDPLPAGLEGVNGSLNTTSFTERPSQERGLPMPAIEDEEFGYDGYYDPYWRWGPFDNVEMRDDRTVLFASYMSPGTYVYEYYARATTPGEYMSLPAHAELLYYPDVFGHSDGGAFRVK